MKRTVILALLLVGLTLSLHCQSTVPPKLALTPHPTPPRSQPVKAFGPTGGPQRARVDRFRVLEVTTRQDEQHRVAVLLAEEVREPELRATATEGTWALMWNGYEAEVRLQDDVISVWGVDSPGTIRFRRAPGDPDCFILLKDGEARVGHHPDGPLPPAE